LGKLGSNLGKNGARRTLRPVKCSCFYFFILKIIFFGFFSSKFAQIWPKFFAPPKFACSYTYAREGRNVLQAFTAPGSSTLIHLRRYNNNDSYPWYYLTCRHNYNEQSMLNEHNVVVIYTLETIVKW